MLIRMRTFTMLSVVLYLLGSTTTIAGSWSRIIGPPGSEEKEQSAPLEITGEQDVLIRNLVIRNPDGPCILISDSVRVRVIDSRIGPCGTFAQQTDDSNGHGVFVYRSSDVGIFRNEIVDAFKGVYAIDSTHLNVSRNHFGGVGRNMVQFDKVYGANNRIVRNVGSFVLGNPVSEDLINLYQTSGEAHSPIRVVGNLLSNGGRSNSGSGILAGDDGGAHQLIARNVLINPGQIGIGVASGSDIRVVDNTVYQTALPWSNTGITVWEQYGRQCTGIKVLRNQVDWRRADSLQNGWWDGGNCNDVHWVGNNFDAELDAGLSQ